MKANYIKQLFLLNKPKESKPNDLKLLGNLFWNVFNTSNSAILLLREDNIVNCNSKLLELFEAKAIDLIGKKPYELSPEFQPDGKRSIDKGKEMIEKAFRDGFVLFQWIQNKVSGEQFIVEVSLVSFKSEGINYATATLRDITTEQKEKEELTSYRNRLEELVSQKTRQLSELNVSLIKTNAQLDITNGELSAAYEELNTANEELLAQNDEITRINEKLIAEIDCHKRTQAEKSVLGEKLNQFISQSTNAIIIINQKGEIEEWNETMHQLTGIPKDETTGRLIWDLFVNFVHNSNSDNDISERFKNNTKQFFSNVLEGQSQNYQFETQFVDKRSNIRFVNIMLYPIYTNLGNYAGCIITDITAKKEADAELEKYKNELELLLADNTKELSRLTVRFNEIYIHTSEAIAFFDIEDINGKKKLKIYDLNPTAQKLFKIDSKRIENGAYAQDIIPDIKYKPFEDKLLPKIFDGKIVNFTEINDTGNGYWNSTIIPIKNEEGEIYRIVSFSRDVTSEHEKDKVSAILQSAIDSWPFEFWVRDKNGRQIIQNKASLEKMGNLIGTTLDDYDIPEERRKLLKSISSKALNGESVNQETEYESNGEMLYVIYSLNPIFSGNTVVGYTAMLNDITPLKRKEFELRESEERFRNIAKLSRHIVFDYNIETGKIIWDGAIEEVTGFTPSEFKDIDFEQWSNMIHPDEKEEILTQTDLSIKALKPINVRYRLRTRNNDYRWIEDNSVLVQSKNDKQNRYIGVMIDITERKIADEKIRASEEKYRLIAENVDDVIWKMDVNTLKYTYVSPSILKLTGFTVEETLQQSFNEMLMPDSLDKALIELPLRIKEVTRGNTAEKSKTYQFKLRHKNGNAVWVEMNTTMLKDSSGKVKEISAVSRNITLRKQAEEKLKESRERYSLVTKLSKYIVFDYDTTQQTIIWEGAIEEVTGYTKDELQKMDLQSLLNLINPNDRDKILVSATGKTIEKNSYNSQYQLLHKQKGYIWIEAQGFLLKDSNNQATRWLGIMKDITEKRNAQQKIVESENKLSTIFNFSKDGMILLDENQQIFEVNMALTDQLNYRKDEIIGKNINLIMVSEKIPEAKQWIQGAWNKTKTNNLETEIKASHNTTYPVEITATPLEIGNKPAMLLMVRDISERKKWEKELLTSIINTEERERTYFSQELHDGLGPLISAAKMYVEWIEKPNAKINRNDVIPDIKKLLEEASDSLRDISFKLSPHLLQNYGLMEAINAYSNKVKKSTDININISSSNQFRIDEKIEIIIYRVLCECINNTLKHSQANNVNINFDVDNESLIIQYTDDGSGFNVSKAFENSSGIGLMNIVSRIKSINGDINIESEPNRGTNISIKINIG